MTNSRKKVKMGRIGISDWSNVFFYLNLITRNPFIMLVRTQHARLHIYITNNSSIISDNIKVGTATERIGNCN